MNGLPTPPPLFFSCEYKVFVCTIYHVYCVIIYELFRFKLLSVLFAARRGQVMLFEVSSTVV